jgi:hypothetical protein
MTQTDLNRLIHFALGPCGRLDLLLAVHRGQIRVIEFDREVMLPSRELKPSTRPTIAVVADDDCASSGPCGWAAASRGLSWGPRRAKPRNPGPYRGRTRGHAGYGLRYGRYFADTERMVRRGTAASYRCAAVIQPVPYGDTRGVLTPSLRIVS